MSRISKFKITTPIRAILKSDSRLKSLVGEKISPIVAPKDTQGDFIIYRRDEYSREYNKMGIHSEKCHVFIDAISDDYDRSKEIAFLIDDILSGFHDTPEMEIKMRDSTEDFEDGKYIQTLLFEVE